MQRLALIADHNHMVDTFRLVLRQTPGFKVVAVADGRVPARMRLRETQPELVLVDDMRQFDATLLRLQEARDELPAAKLVLLAGAMDGDRMNQALDAGADAVIAKSVHPAALATLLHETLKGTVFHSTRSLRRRPEHALHDTLTGRELEILQMVARGQTNQQISRELWVTEKTVKFHLSNVYRKLGVANRTSASHYAHSHALLGRERLAS